MNKYWIGVLLLTSMPAWAVLPFEATPAERAMCEARGIPGGQGHYCDGLRFFDRANAAMSNKQAMQYYLQESLSGFNYVLGHAQESDVIRGEVHLGKARTLKLMGRNAEAAAELNNALRYKVDSPDVYQALADHYHEAGNKQKAMEMVTEGLQRNPNSKGLKRRYTEFGGKLPYPESVAKTLPVEKANDEIKPGVKLEAAPPSGETTGQAAVAPSEQIKLKTEDKAESVPASTQTTPAEPVATPQIGSPKNPYCRFCAD